MIIMSTANCTVPLVETVSYIRTASYWFTNIQSLLIPLHVLDDWVLLMFLINPSENQSLLGTSLPCSVSSFQVGKKTGHNLKRPRGQISWYLGQQYVPVGI